MTRFHDDFTPGQAHEQTVSIATSRESLRAEDIAQFGRFCLDSHRRERLADGVPVAIGSRSPMFIWVFAQERAAAEIIAMIVRVDKKQVVAFQLGPRQPFMLIAVKHLSFRLRVQFPIDRLAAGDAAGLNCKRIGSRRVRRADCHSSSSCRRG